MNIDPSRKPNSMECIRCGDCVRACPEKALHIGVRDHRANAGSADTSGAKDPAGS